MVYSVCQIHTVSSWVCANRRRKGRMTSLYPVCTLVMAKLVLLQPKILLVGFHPKQERWKSFIYDSNAGVFNIIFYNIKVVFFFFSKAHKPYSDRISFAWRSGVNHLLLIGFYFYLDWPYLWFCPSFCEKFQTKKKHCFWTNCVVVWSCLHIDW